MPPADPAAARRRDLNAQPLRESGDYVLYWVQMFRRLEHNHALDFALRTAGELGKPLVVYEGLKLGYPWANVRHHQFILEGMRDNARAAAALRLNYWPFAETPADPGRGLLRSLAALACLVVTDDYPAFIVPAQSAALAARVDVRVTAIDGNGLVPLSQMGAPVSAANHLRSRLHRLFPDAWAARADAEPRVPDCARRKIDAPFTTWDATQDIGKFLDGLPLDRAVPAVAGVEGGAVAGRAVLAKFVAARLGRYAADRNSPTDPGDGFNSRLSPYLHYGHVSVQEAAEAALRVTGTWAVSDLDPKARGKKDGYFCRDDNVNSFFDEFMTWRDTGFHWHYHRHADIRSLDAALPEWAKVTLAAHAADRRDHVYTPEQFEAGDTHDALWNAAHRELLATGRIHNYMRMLWGKKVLEWSPSPAEAYKTLEHLNNKYALDGRDPNSYSGILWCFGLFDRPWPERPVFGKVRYMSSASTERKFDLKPYLRYVAGLPAAGARLTS